MGRRAARPDQSRRRRGRPAVYPLVTSSSQQGRGGPGGTGRAARCQPPARAVDAQRHLSGDLRGASSGWWGWRPWSSRRAPLLGYLHAKGDRDRQVKLGLALPVLARYLGIGRPRQVALGAHRLPGAGPSALFLSDAVGGARNRSGRLTTNGVYELLTERWHQAGRTGHFGAHRLRHGLATLLVEANVSLAIVAAWLGHSLETTTMLYAHPTVGAMHRHVGPVVADSLRGAGLDELGAA